MTIHFGSTLSAAAPVGVATPLLDALRVVHVMAWANLFSEDDVAVGGRGMAAAAQARDDAVDLLGDLLGTHGAELDARLTPHEGAGSDGGADGDSPPGSPSHAVRECLAAAEEVAMDGDGSDGASTLGMDSVAEESRVQAGAILLVRRLLAVHGADLDRAFGSAAASASAPR